MRVDAPVCFAKWVKENKTMLNVEITLSISAKYIDYLYSFDHYVGKLYR